MQAATIEMMRLLLKSLVTITAQRDNTRLAESVITALYALTRVRQIRVHDIFPVREKLFVQEKMRLDDGRLSIIAKHSGDDVKASLNGFPAILECIRHHKNEHVEIDDGSHVLWLPVWLHGKVHTCLEIRHPHAYDAVMRELIDGVFSMYCNQQSLLDHSGRDALTGLFNRRTFDEQFSPLAFSMALREAHPVDHVERRHAGDIRSHWLAVTDIDHFKQVNDQYGHLYGDEVLILMGSILSTSFRSRDHIFRFGGEEFVILLRSTTLEEARGIFDRFRRHVQEYDFPHMRKITVSLGFAGITDDTPAVILGRADQALYHAKKNGRNSICFHDDMVTSGVPGNALVAGA